MQVILHTDKELPDTVYQPAIWKNISRYEMDSTLDIVVQMLQNSNMWNNGRAGSEHVASKEYVAGGFDATYNGIIFFGVLRHEYAFDKIELYLHEGSVYVDVYDVDLKTLLELADETPNRR